jgi:DNA-directed RNA polymerase subunit RPC12/RpoP
MSTFSAYFIPGHKFAIGQFGPKVRHTLEELEIIERYFNEEDEGIIASGKVPFEYAAIHDSDKDRIVPETSSAGYGSTCPVCGADIDDAFYESLNDFYDRESAVNLELDMKDMKVRCRHCEHTFLLSEIKFQQGAVLSNQYFQFVGIDKDIQPELLEKLETVLGCRLNLIYEIL